MSNNYKSTALLLLDLQNEMVSPDGKIGGNGLAQVIAERQVLQNAKRALEAARKRGELVVHVRLGFRSDYADALSVAPRIAKLKESGAAILGEWGTAFPEEVTPLASEVVITKQCVNPFFNTGLMSWLTHNKIDHVALCGVATNLVVESSARYCDDAGLAVTILEDACAAPNLDWHAFAMNDILPLFATISSTIDYAK